MHTQYIYLGLKKFPTDENQIGSYILICRLDLDPIFPQFSDPDSVQHGPDPLTMASANDSDWTLYAVGLSR